MLLVLKLVPSYFIEFKFIILLRSFSENQDHAVIWTGYKDRVSCKWNFIVTIAIVTTIKTTFSLNE